MMLLNKNNDLPWTSLSEVQAIERLAQFGLNELPQAQKVSFPVQGRW